MKDYYRISLAVVVKSEFRIILKVAAVSEEFLEHIM